jgi:oxygen-dependent protoporphyrinogen oxidase
VQVLDTPHTSAIVVGAGIAGLTAAYRLQQAGFAVSVLEAKSLPGGRMADEMRGSLYAFTGATVLFAFYRDMWALIDELGMKDKLIAVPALGRGIADNVREIYPVDFNKTWGMLGHRGLSWRSRICLARLIPDVLAARRHVDPCLLHTAASLDDESMSEYLTRKVGRDFVEHIVAPVYRTLWAWNIESISRAYFLSIYAHVRGQPSFRLQGGLGVLTRELAQRVPVRYDTRVCAIRRAGPDSKRAVEFASPHGEGTLRADLVVCAVEGAKVTDIVVDQAPYEREFFTRGVPYARFAMVIYVVKELRNAHPIRTFYTREHRNPISFLFTHPGNPAMRGDPPRLWVVMSPDRAAHYFGANGENLESSVRKFVREKYPLHDDDIVEIHELLHDYTIAEFPTGQLRRVRRFLASQEAGPKNIYYVGEYLSNATTGGACASGTRTSEQIIANWGGGSHALTVAKRPA